MSKLEAVIGIQGSDEYNEGFNAGVSFVKTVIESKEFEDKLFKAIIKANTNNDINIRIIDTLKEFNL
jgi:hypothetical protein